MPLTQKRSASGFVLRQLSPSQLLHRHTFYAYHLQLLSVVVLQTGVMSDQKLDNSDSSAASQQQEELAPLSTNACIGHDPDVIDLGDGRTMRRSRTTGVKSIQTVPNHVSNAVSQQQTEDASHSADGHIPAPYHRHERTRRPNEYLVVFNPGHTLEKHFAFLGFEFEVVIDCKEWYGVDMDEQLLNAIRQDPGVEFVEDNQRGKRG